MVWVRGGIILHGLEAYGVHFVSQAISSTADAAAHGLMKWLITAFLSGLVGLCIGAISISAIG
ncbi:DUF808 family protein [Bradyrhizobium jicamae]|uniref:DUF808 family protein n=1 Tax=Bradyrhizobium jicamae TaxID=280332 RepID=A0ABS5FE01_9BRAD|nr:DUF808 family protein [Bradyrhizobium jicamae]